jgi:hypothetical protein
VQIIPSEGQLPYCLVFTQSEKGGDPTAHDQQDQQLGEVRIRRAGLGQTYKIPVEEGP